MADLGQFARRIRLIGRGIEKNTGGEVRKTAALAGQVLVLSTPVDTGRARANWITSVGIPITEDIEDNDVSGSATIARNNTTIRAQKSGQTIYISNNLPYIGKLNEGSSAQAPANFVEIAVRIAVSALKKAKVVQQ